mgnify:CR=1 FL=1
MAVSHLSVPPMTYHVSFDRAAATRGTMSQRSVPEPPAARDQGPAPSNAPCVCVRVSWGPHIPHMHIIT